MKKIIALLLVAVMCMGLFVGCGKSDEGNNGTTKGASQAEELAAAKEYLYSLLVNASTETATDLEYPARVKGGNTYFDIEWTVEIVSGEGEIKVVPSQNAGFVVVDVPSEAATDINYKLTANIKGNGESVSLVYNYTVPAFALTSFEEYAAAEKGALMIVQGVVTAILSQSYGDSANGLYFQDNDGGYYAYNTTVDPVVAGVDIGMTVRVTGTKDIYQGTYEVVGGEIEIIDSNKNPVEAVDFTELYINAETLKDAALTTQQSMLVTVKGVEITKKDDKYLKFTLAGKETYIYISSSNTPMSKDDENTLVATYGEKSGYLADVTGLITQYNGSFYLTPVSVDAFVYHGLPQKSDAEKVAYEKGNLEFPKSVSKATEIDLASAGATFADVVIAWAVSGNGAEIVNGKLVLTPGAQDSIVTVTATLTAGEASENVEFQIKLNGTESNVSITLTDKVNNGDKIVMFLPDSSVAISGEANGKKLVGVEAILNGNALTAPEAAIMDVIVDADGYYTFIYNGKYLTSGETGSSLSWADEASAYSLWILEETEGGFYIKNVNAAYNGNPQYVEYYSGFTTYGFQAAKANIYLIQIFAVVEEGGATGPKVDTAYNFGMIQENVSATDIYYLNGAMNGYYMDTTTNAAESLVIYLEATEGGYYMYTTIGGEKTYINMVVSGTHVNGAYEATASTVYTWDADAQTLVAEINGNIYWFGTRNDKTYTTVGPVATSYNGFYCMLYPVQG